MQGLNPNFASHELNIKEGFRPIKQKLRHQGPERNAAAAEEVKKLLEAGIIEECQYTEWLANVVLVKKASGAWRMCVDFTDLNKACPKETIPSRKLTEDIEVRESWELQVDGSATKSGSGAGLVILPSIGDKMEYAVKFDFLASNNEAEYEALILGLQICITSGAQNILAKSDSQLIVGQVSGEYEAKEDNMRMYLNKTRQLIQKLTSFKIQHFPRSENQQADALARMASSAEGLAPAA
ncbi:uncharacterized protein LOC130591477 [Beta vulgaris subsp. vulgaris]|uniref:uncharacterized protein LOC130591477 n=1 Tax=Beta vulgaris subsp. vulgaris TaxID=3555 RepID=UPI0025470F98|nr:uncharacterized protein LOC130591477 [Beta vulgaris subsp. vulgaris]